MLPERMYRSLREGRLPKVYPARTIIQRTQGVAKTLRMRRGNVRNLTTKLVRPLAARKAVAITDTKFSGYETIYRGAYLGRYNDAVSYKASYKSQFMRPTMAKIVQSIGDVEETVHVAFMPQAPFDKTVKKAITEPVILSCTASVFSERGWFKYDGISESYTLGVLDDRYKPAAEYPVSGVDNAILDLSYSWKIENKIYPQPLPSGLSFSSLDVSASYGHAFVGDKFYKDPTEDNKVNTNFTVKNTTGAKITIKHWGLLISVMYEDNQRVSQANIAAIIPTREVANGSSTTYNMSFTVPNWCYGKIAVAHALNFYKDDMFIYGGGPLYQCEIFRILLP